MEFKKGPASISPERPSRVEAHEAEKTFETVLEEMQETERRYSERVHEIVAERVTQDRRKNIPAWGRKALALAFLTGVETAHAQELVTAENDHPVEVSHFLLTNAEIPYGYDAHPERLERYTKTAEEGVWTSLTVYALDKKHKTTMRADLHLPELTEAAGDGEVIAVDGFVSEIKLQQMLDEVQVPDIHDDSWRVISFENDDTFFATKTYLDEYGNIVETNVYKMKGDDPGEFLFKRDDWVTIPVDFHESTDELQPVKFSLWKSGGHESFSNQVFHTSLPAEREIVNGVPFSCFDADPESLEDIPQEQMKVVAKGLRNIRSLFGDLDDVRGVYLRQNDEANAAAYWSTQLIELQTGLFDELKYRPDALEEVVEHEALHQKDFELGFSSVAELVDLWSATSPNTLSQLNEGNFNLSFGGHAQDNPAEFVATTLNSLDDERWLENVGALSPEAREVYRQALAIMADHLVDNEEVPRHAPIHKLLDKRIKQLNEIVVE